VRDLRANVENNRLVTGPGRCGIRRATENKLLPANWVVGHFQTVHFIASYGLITTINDKKNKMSRNDSTKKSADATTVVAVGSGSVWR
jgi:hypothetical protein